MSDAEAPTPVNTLLTLDEFGPMRFRAEASHAPHGTRLYGGQVAAQALMAAGRTVPAERRVHSAHVYFLRAGDSSAPVEYQVADVRNGRAFSVRTVAAIQDGVEICSMMASFTQPTVGVAHQVPSAAPPPPESLPPAHEHFAADDATGREWFADFAARYPMDVRFVSDPPRVVAKRGSNAPPRSEAWIRTSDELPDDPLWQACGLMYLSDMFLLASLLPPHGELFGGAHVLVASLDHAVWFHRPARSDDWLFYDDEGQWAGEGRGLSRGRFFTCQGELAATVMQEGVIRMPRL